MFDLLYDDVCIVDDEGFAHGHDVIELGDYEECRRCHQVSRRGNGND